MWSHFIDHYNGKSVILKDVWQSSDEALLFTDASGAIGFAYPWKINVHADHLSRFNFQAAFQIAPHLKRQQTSVPSKFLTI